MFLYSTLAVFGLSLVGLPVLIHLINMLRHRRVKWAAMEFLLQSQKRHKKWVILKQLLLLLMRMGAIAALAMMVAQPILRNDLGKALGGTKTHHVVLLDDSFSMTDRWANTNALARAKRVVHLLAERVKDDAGAQTFSLLRFSKAPKLTPGSQPLLYQRDAKAELTLEVEQALAELEASETPAGPTEALKAFLRVMPASEDENRIVYLVSDFRSVQWDEATELRKLLEKVEQAGAAIRLVDCADTRHANLAITQLRAKSGARAAGVETLMEVAVRNFGATTARLVAVELEEDGFSRPSVVIEEILPGETVSRTFRVNFSTAGHHSLIARLGGDAVHVDNTRYYTVDLPEVIPVLLVDGGEEARDAYFLATSLDPGGKTRTGWKPRIESPRFLRDAENLDEFGAVFLLNIERLDSTAIGVLEQYVRTGGGLAFFLGERSRWQFFNEQLYQDGAGLFPVPLRMSTELLRERLNEAPDFSVSDHPVFAVMSGTRNPFLSMVQVQRYFPISTEWSIKQSPHVQILARLRNGDPLALEKKYGNGRVIAFLTKTSPEETRLGSWNNWARNNPSFPIAMNELAGYLSAPRRMQAERLVGQPLLFTLDSKKYRPDVGFLFPDGEREETHDAKGDPDEAMLTVKLADTDVSGIYEARVTNDAGEEERHLFGYNVDCRESDLAKLDRQELAKRLDGIRYEYNRAEDFENRREELAGFNLSDTFLYLLIGLLLLEQLLAYSASYHPPRMEERG